MRVGCARWQRKSRLYRARVWPCAKWRSRCRQKFHNLLFLLNYLFGANIGVLHHLLHFRVILLDVLAKFRGRITQRGCAQRRKTVTYGLLRGDFYDGAVQPVDDVFRRSGGREQTRRDEPVRPSKSGAGPGSGPRAGPVSNAAGQSSSRSPRPPAAAGVAALLLLCGWLWPAIAQAQSDWARGDAAFKKRDWVRAESLYTRRAKGGRAPAALLANLAAARAQHAGSDTLVERTLSHLSAREDRAGQMSGYNLGTLLGRRQEYDRALGELRRALERNPDEPDARWNYELLNRLREQEQQQQKPQPNAPQNGPQDPQPQQPDPQAGQGPQPGQQPPPQAGSQSQSEQADAPAAPGMQQPMTKEQAERLLGSLGDLERLEKQNQRRSRVQREKKGKDW